MVLPGNINDKAWNQAGYKGLMLLKSDLGAKVSFSEKVPHPNQVEAMSHYARQGNRVVIGHGGEFQDAANRVARKYPDTTFLVSNGVKGRGNLAAFGFAMDQMGYLVGYFAGLQSKTGVIGGIGAQKIQAYQQLLNGYKRGAEAANPKIKVLISYTNDWDDIAKGKEAALNLISNKADIVFPTMDNAVIGSLQACKEKGAKAIGIYYDAIQDWPGTVIQSAILDVPHAIKAVLSEPIKTNTPLKGRIYKLGLETPEAVRLGSFGPGISQDLKDKVAQVKADILSGKIKTSGK
jgi:basic membrane protein A